MKLSIYIDGSCRPSTKFGSYGILVVNEDGTQYSLSGTQEDVTNNIMELTALIEALKHIRDNELHEQYDIEIFCDSQYVVNGVNSWWKKWKANGFRTTTGLVKNLELWKQIETLRNEVDCQLTWVKGHAQNEKHNEVDRLVFGLTDKSRKSS